MIRKINRVIQDFLRPKRLAIGKIIWDKKQVGSDFDKLLINNKINMSKIESILFLRYDGKIGDMVISTILFRELKIKYPKIKIGVVVREGGTLEIAKEDNNIDKIHIFHKGKEGEEGKEISKYKYDILVDFSEFLRVNQMKYIKKCNAKINIGLNKENWNLFDISYSLNKNKHITDLYSRILKIFGIDNPNLKSTFSVSEKFLNKIDVKENIVLLNPYAASKHRSINRENILKISKNILSMNTKCKLIILAHGENRNEILEILKELDERAICPKTNLMEAAAWVEKSKLVISPDTAIVHIAAALGKPLIAIYREDKNDQNYNLWAPNSKNAQILIAKNLAKKGEESNINTFNLNELLEKIKEQLIK